MKAAWIEKRGPADNIHFGDMPSPSPGRSEVLVRVAATTVNHVDTFVRSGAYRTEIPFPFVIGRDLAGMVVWTGRDVTGFKVGDAVWCNSLGHDGRQGAGSELAVVPADRLYFLPEDVDPVAAVAVLHPGATAYLGLVIHAELQSGESVYISGAAGHVGSAAVVLAAAMGARVVASAGADDLEYCRSLGAEPAVDYRDPDLDRLLNETAPDGFDIQLDTSGHAPLDAAVGRVAGRGRIVLMAGMQRRPALPVGMLYTRDAAILGFAISNATVEELAAAATAINKLLEAGALQAREIDRLPLAAAAEAHRRLEAGEVRGTRLVLVP